MTERVIAAAEVSIPRRGRGVTNARLKKSSPDSFCGGLSCFWDFGSGGTGQGGWIRLGSGESVPSSRLLSALIRDHGMRP
jgi:hypothetical protein